MNRFIIDNTPDGIAQAMCDKHVVKMPLEEAQKWFEEFEEFDWFTGEIPWEEYYAT